MILRGNFSNIVKDVNKNNENTFKKGKNIFISFMFMYLILQKKLFKKI